MALHPRWRALLPALLLILSLQAAPAPSTDPGDLLELGPVVSTPTRNLVAQFQARVASDLGERARAFSAFPPAKVFRHLVQEHVASSVPSRAFRYASIDAHGHPRAYSGRVFLPSRKAGAPPLPLPLVIYQHGTETRRTYTPYHLQGDETMLGALAAEGGGFAVAMPDGDGMGADPSPEMHAYCHGATGARALIDCIQALLGGLETGESLFDNKDYVWDGRLFIVGYSEGGYLAMAAVKELTTNPAWRDIKLTGAACMGGPFHFARFAQDLLADAKTPYDRPYIPAYLLAAWEQLFPGQISFGAALHPALLQPDAQDGNAKDWLSGKLGGDEITPRIQARLAQDPRRALPVASLLAPRWIQENVHVPSSPFLTLLKENDLVGGWAPSIPVFLAHDPFDEVVAFSNSRAVFEDWKKRGAHPMSVLELAVAGQGSGHVGGALLAIPAAFTWIAAGMPERFTRMAQDQIQAQIRDLAPKEWQPGAEALAAAMLGTREQDQPLFPLSRLQGSTPCQVTFNDLFAVVGKVKFYTLSPTPGFPGQRPLEGLGGYPRLVKEMKQKGDSFTLDPSRPCFMAVYPQNGFVGLTLKFAGPQESFLINIKQAFKNKVLHRSPQPHFSVSDNLKPRVHLEAFERPGEVQPFIGLP